MAGDVVGLAHEVHDGEPLLVPVMRGGRRLDTLSGLTAARTYAAAQLRMLPEPLRALEDAPPYPVTISGELQALAARLDAEAH
jgi:nicotinate phosphoribosyltransferase